MDELAWCPTRSLWWCHTNANQVCLPVPRALLYNLIHTADNMLLLINDFTISYTDVVFFFLNCHKQWWLDNTFLSASSMFCSRNWLKNAEQNRTLDCLNQHPRCHRSTTTAQVPQVYKCIFCSHTRVANASLSVRWLKINQPKHWN